MIVDCHAHAGNYEQVLTDHNAHLDQLLEAMAEAGVGESWVLPIPTGPDEPVSQKHNEVFISNVLQHDNLVPFCTVDVTDSKTSHRQLKAAVAMGARGWKFHPILQRTEINSRELYPSYAYAEEQQLPVLIHAGQFIGHRVAGKLFPGPLRMADPLGIDDVADTFPDLKIIMAHFGWPWLSHSIAIATRRDNVYLDLSGWAPKHFPAELVAQALKAMPHKFLFGTDYPFITPQRWLTEFRAMAADRPAALQAVCESNIDNLRMPA